MDSAVLRFSRRNPFTLASLSLVEEDSMPEDKTQVGIRRNTVDRMILVRLAAPQRGILPVIASYAELHGDHIVLLRSTGRLAALFLAETVESWSVV
jgi:hypothetical protein